MKKKKTLNEGVCVPITQFGENVGPFTKETPYAETVGIVNKIHSCGLIIEPLSDQEVHIYKDKMTNNTKICLRVFSSFSRYSLTFLTRAG